MVEELVVADIGGTHARFAIAYISDKNGISLDHQITMESREHASLQTAWQAYTAQLEHPLPTLGAVAAAGPVGGDILRFTNSSWIVHPGTVAEKLGLSKLVLINDFAAVAHTAAKAEASQLRHVCGPDSAGIPDGITTIVGPGTGLGVAQFLKTDAGYHVIETEGGHIDFSPLDEIEDRLLHHLRKQHRRGSVERLVSGPGLQTIYQVLAEIESDLPQTLDDKQLWALALSGEDSLASAALDRFCMCLGAVAGDLALAQGAKSVVMAGGLGARIGNALGSSGFKERFVAKGRFQSLMENIPVKHLLHPEPGLYGAAAAFVKDSQK